MDWNETSPMLQSSRYQPGFPYQKGVPGKISFVCRTGSQAGNTKIQTKKFQRAAYNFRRRER